MARAAAPKKVKPNLGIRAIKSLNVGFYGEEPIYDRLMTVREVEDALTWYAYNMDEKEGVSYLVTYLNNIGKIALAKQVKAGGDKFFSPTLFKYARILNNGGKLPEISMNHFINGLTKDSERFIEHKASNKKFTMPARLNEASVSILNDIEAAIDVRNAKFKVDVYIKNKGVAEEFVIKVINHYAAELTAATKYEQTEEVVSYVAYVTKIVKALKAMAGIEDRKPATTVRKPRKPRAKKVVPAEKKVASLKFKAEDSELGVKSIKPTDIIGKDQLWVYDTRFNKLTLFKAKNEQGLDVKGTTILNWDEKLSICKRAGRAAKKIVPDVTKIGKVALRSVHKDIKSAAITVSGRIGENTLLLRVEK